MHARILRPLPSDGSNSVLHCNQTAVSVFEGIRWFGERRCRAKHDLSYSRLDPVAADNGVCHSASSILKDHLLLPIGQSGNSRQPFPKPRKFRRQKLDQMIEESRPMDSVLAQLVRDRKRRFVGRICVAIQVIEPDLLLRRPHVLGADLAVGFCDSRVTDVHGLHGWVRLPLLVASSLSISAFAYSALSEITGLELAAVSRDLTQEWQVAAIIVWKLISLLVAFSSGYDCK